MVRVNMCDLLWLSDGGLGANAQCTRDGTLLADPSGVNRLRHQCG